MKKPDITDCSLRDERRDESATLWYKNYAAHKLSPVQLVGQTVEDFHSQQQQQLVLLILLFMSRWPSVAPDYSTFQPSGSDNVNKTYEASCVLLTRYSSG